MALSCGATLVMATISPTPILSPLDPSVHLPNPWAVAGLAGVAGFVSDAGVVALLLTMLMAVVGVALRFRSDSAVERQQLRWVRAGAALAVGGMLVIYIGQGLFGLPERVAGNLGTIGIACLPVSFTVAILRYRLYDLDRVVSRTVSYAAVTGLLVVTYVVAVTAASRLTRGGSSLAVAASTLAVAALFQPVRRRMQNLVDRRFNRARYDAARTVEGFRTRLRSQVDIDAVSSDLLRVANDTMQPASAALWLRRPDGATR
jgi:hypothetical protein